MLQGPEESYDLSDFMGRTEVRIVESRVNKEMTARISLCVKNKVSFYPEEVLPSS